MPRLPIEWSGPSEEDIHAEPVAALEAIVFVESRASDDSELINRTLCLREALRGD